MNEYEDFHFEIINAEEAEIQEYQKISEQISNNLQEITKYLGSENSDIEEYLKIRFPYGYIRTADLFREKLKCVDDKNIKTNIAYSLILSDLFNWLIRRTNIQGTLQEMIIKNEILLMASICETLIVIKVGKRKCYKERVEKMLEDEIITPELKEDLLWLWDKRTGIHIFELTEKEYEKYAYDDFKKSKEIAYNLVQVLNKNIN